ncbi:MAG: Carbohydrate/purine kinase pfkB family protein [Candidatus Moranbacteria bacterium GW2011_GWE1_49_15]|nr:MAG: Carbohydrate/purine kinase pfkB family protein [Candidatus Moranbacteria bacterium GW2011_GWE2_47_10]KKW07604.1 MAG: Carbohydrate/purine kinase pfkB family protein [Candidatus Moranbacteria bacterium GW2011_GWE1_49_15]HBP01062.1 hypothetical protein [Candidatus Moranbacteria bacterium]
MLRKFFSKSKRRAKTDTVICIGSSSKDVFFPTDKGVIFDTPKDLTAQKKIAFELGAKYQVEDRFETVGGCAANVAYGLARLGADVRCCTKIGDDSIGEWIGQELKKGGVGLDVLQKEKKCKSDLSFILVDAKTGERTVFSDRSANEKLEIIPGKLRKADWLFVSSLNGPWQENLKKILKFSSEKKKRIAFNPGQKNIATDTEAVIGAITRAELLMLNKDEALEIVTHVALGSTRKQLNDEAYLLEKLKDLGPRVVLITDGIRGAWAKDENGISHAAAIVVEAVDTTGSGDAFTSGFFGALLKGKTLGDALAWGIVNGSNSVKEYGGQKGLLREKEIRNIAKHVKIEKVNQ